MQNQEPIAKTDKRFRLERFHSHLLIPWKIAQQAVKENDSEPILLWIDAYQTGYHFKEGDEVAHKEYPIQKMFVQKILVSNITRKDNTKLVKMIGILCHWFESCPCIDDVKYQSSEKE